MKNCLFLTIRPTAGDVSTTGSDSLTRKKERQTEVIVFHMADAVVSAKTGQKTLDGYYNVERMLKRVLSINGKVGTCMDARGFDDAALMAGACRSTLDELAAATAEVDKVLVF